MQYKKYSKLLILLLMVFAMLFSNQLSAQALTKITIKAGENLSAVYKQMYRFPKFTNGKVYFINKDSAVGKLNYNLMMGKMQFIDKSGDTLVLSDNNPIRLVVIDTVIFYCNSGECVELLAGYPPAELAVGYRLKFTDEQKIGAFGLPTSTQTIDNKNALIDNNYQLLLNKDLIFTKETSYHFIDQSRNFLPANKKTLFKLFPKQKIFIEDYLQKTTVDFKNESDLKILFSYLVNSF